MNRKIIQIQTTLCTTNNKPVETLYALCDDGSVWENSFIWEKDQWSGWRLVPSLSNTSTMSQLKILAIHPQFMVDNTE